MIQSKQALRSALVQESEQATDPSPLAVRLLSDSEVDWVGGGTTHSMTGLGVYAMGSGSNASYVQTGGSFSQSGDNQTYGQGAGDVTQQTTIGVNPSN